MVETIQAEIKASKEPFLSPEREYKLILVGNSGVGKTTLIHKVIQGVFLPIHNVTIAGDFSTIYYTVDKVKTKLQLWDTCGLEKYRSTSRIFFRGAHAAFVIFDTTDEHSLASCADWIHEVREFAVPSAVLALVGSKIDMPNPKVTRDMALRFAAAYKIASVHFISSKTHENVEALLTATKLALHSGFGAPLVSRQTLPERPLLPPQQPHGCDC